MNDRPNSGERATSSTRRKRIEGRVASVLNERELVINVGSIHGVKERMHFKVMAEKDLEIIDPVTQESLGVLEQEKVRVEATSVLEKMTVCRTYIYSLEGGAMALAMSDFHDMHRPVVRVFETLNANKEDKPAPLSQEESYVKIGDRVVQLHRTEENTVAEPES